MTIPPHTGPGRLLYVVGPSGAGKDALLEWVSSRLSGGVAGGESGGAANTDPGAKADPGAGSAVRFARRWITRPAEAGGEQHHPITPTEFESRLAADDFALAWRANGNCYGIGNEIRDWLDAGLTVVVNGSREYLPEALKRFPALRVISVSAGDAVLRERLERRGRESLREIEARLERTRKLALPELARAVEIRNDGAPEEAGAALLKVILGR